jgi:hypothetical protein
MKSVAELRVEQNRVRVDLLFTDAELALTMVDLARASDISEFKERRLKEALKAYKFILRQSGSVSLTPQQKAILNQKLALLKQKLMFFD